MRAILPVAALPVPRMAPAGDARIIEPMPVHAARALERLAGASVDAGERRAILRFVGGLFLLLAAYYILKVVREPLILATGSAVGRSYARALQAALLVAVIPLYSALANRVGPSALVQYVFLFFVASLLAFVGLGLAGAAVGFAFFVWLGIFSTMSIAQFWSLANARSVPSPVPSSPPRVSACSGPSA
jgi:hypothetical protein